MQMHSAVPQLQVITQQLKSTARQQNVLSLILSHLPSCSGSIGAVAFQTEMDVWRWTH